MLSHLLGYMHPLLGHVLLLLSQLLLPQLVLALVGLLLLIHPQLQNFELHVTMQRNHMYKFSNDE